MEWKGRRRRRRRKGERREKIRCADVRGKSRKDFMQSKGRMCGCIRRL